MMTTSIETTELQSRLREKDPSGWKYSTLQYIKVKAKEKVKNGFIVKSQSIVFVLLTSQLPPWCFFNHILSHLTTTTTVDLYPLKSLGPGRLRTIFLCPLLPSLRSLMFESVSPLIVSISLVDMLFLGFLLGCFFVCFFSHLTPRGELIYSLCDRPYTHLSRYISKKIKR